ncbi:alpha/beta fold hydrolase [Chitinophaga arvensicola]|uniref:Pimeloyl-ACP methyl ester carboxylesterase n=1 Tax=Chitinophaga arvensicola TaxID=29529 RepID=A0A1I0QCF1_9BACT|nr:alpha/beta hydrolase [Chitinophaga arvensicola]SEW24722.1 Pimeloyl-ACP methyl ester carboxylesterase [Chitinophaga arvensicola]
MTAQPVKIISTDSLQIAYLEHGASDGWPVLLSHGFPYDAHSFNEVASILTQAGARVIAPFTRGFGETRFISADVMRSGQQGARGRDVIQLCQALELKQPIVAGFDWGGNACCTAAALWPEQIGGLVSYAGYDIVDVNQQRHAATPSLERVCWYQHLFQSERGRECLAENRYELPRMLWREWSPDWQFDEATFARTAKSFDNPDFVDVVVHTYRWMHGHTVNDPTLQRLEDRLAQKPKITVPTVTIDGANDPLKPGGTADHAGMFIGQHTHIVADTGHNVPQEAPQVFADAVLTVYNWLK